MRRMVQEIAFEILEQIIDIIFIQPSYCRRRSLRAGFGKARFNYGAIKRDHRVTVKILHEGIRHDFHDVGFRQHAADHRHAGQAVHRARREARHKAG